MTAAVVLAAAAVAVIVVLTHRGSGVDRWGQNPATVAKQLRICTAPTPYGDTTVGCTTAGGDRISVTTFTDETTQQFFVAIAKDKADGTCMVVAKGFVVGASSSSALTSAIGIPEAFAAKHHGYLVCPGS